MKRINKTGKRMYSDEYIEVATSNQSARLISVLIALSLQGLRDVTSVERIEADLYYYVREGKKFFIRMDGNNIAERAPLT